MIVTRTRVTIGKVAEVAEWSVLQIPKKVQESRQCHYSTFNWIMPLFDLERYCEQFVDECYQDSDCMKYSGGSFRMTCTIYPGIRTYRSDISERYDKRKGLRYVQCKNKQWRYCKNMHILFQILQGSCRSMSIRWGLFQLWTKTRWIIQMCQGLQKAIQSWKVIL